MRYLPESPDSLPDSYLRDIRLPVPDSKDFNDCCLAANLFLTGSATTRGLVMDEVNKRSTGFKNLFGQLAR